MGLQEVRRLEVRPEGPRRFAKTPDVASGGAGSIDGAAMRMIAPLNRAEPAGRLRKEPTEKGLPRACARVAYW